MAHDEVDALVSFFESWAQNGVGEDGLPLFEQRIMIRKAKPPLLMVEEPATEDDQEYFADAWRHFQKTAKIRNVAVTGYPLVFWPVVSPADLQSLAVRDIVTVEQLAEEADKKASKLPPPLHELAKRAKQLVAMQGKVGKFEAIIHELTAQRDTLSGELKEANDAISALNHALKARAA